MPQPLRHSIGFTEEGLNRLKSLAESTGASQRDIICALLELDDETVIRRVCEYKINQQRLAEERKETRKKVRTLLKKVTPEQLEKFIAGIQ